MQATTGGRGMLGRLYEGEDCSAARTLELVGERWTLLILRDAIFRGSTRFSQFQGALAIAPNILTKRLAALVDAGLLHVADGIQDYRLTEKGRSLAPVLIALTRWGDEWVGAGPVAFGHDDCDADVEQPLRCPRHAGEIAPERVHVRLRDDDERAALDRR